MNKQHHTTTVQTTEPKFVKGEPIKFTVLKDWPNYNLRTLLEWHKNDKTGEYEKTNYQTIRYNGRFVNHMSTLYNVLPNEDVLRTADLVAQRLGAKFLEPKWKSHNWKYGWCRPAGHVLTNPEKTVMMANYQIGKPVDITGAKDFVDFGFSVKNSIDGKGGAFVVMPSTLTQVCQNVAYHVTKAATLHQGYKAPELANIKGRSFTYHAYKSGEAIEVNEKDPILKQAFAEIDKAKKNFEAVNYKKPHFSTLTLEYVTNAILTVVQMGEELLDAYRAMYKTKVTLKNAQLLYEKMPKAISEDLAWIEIDHKTKKVSLKKEINEYKAFNDITNKLTFGNRNFGSTLEAYAKLDEILVRPH